MMLRAILYLFLLAVPAACDRSGAVVVKEASAEEKARVEVVGAGVAKGLMEALGSELRRVMEVGGPLTAIPLCQKIALPLTAAASDSQDVIAVRRTTLKPRNPANAATERDRVVLELMAMRSEPEVEIRREGDAAHYYQPLIVQEVCLKCHGDPSTFPKELSEVLAASYPADKATGYVLGDLRGAIHVTIAIP